MQELQNFKVVKFFGPPGITRTNATVKITSLQPQGQCVRCIQTHLSDDAYILTPHTLYSVAHVNFR